MLAQTILSALSGDGHVHNVLKSGEGDFYWSGGLRSSHCWLWLLLQPQPPLLWADAQLEGLIPTLAIGFIHSVGNFGFHICHAMMTISALLQLYSIIQGLLKFFKAFKLPLILRINGVISVCCATGVSAGSVFPVPLLFITQHVRGDRNRWPSWYLPGIRAKGFLI